MRETIFSEVSPFQKILDCHSILFLWIAWVHSIIFVALFPTRIFHPHTNDSGLSVFSLNVRVGICKIYASS
jgi:hypothetical protein